MIDEGFNWSARLLPVGTVQLFAFKSTYCGKLVNVGLPANVPVITRRRFWLKNVCHCVFKSVVQLMFWMTSPRVVQSTLKWSTREFSFVVAFVLRNISQENGPIGIGNDVDAVVELFHAWIIAEHAQTHFISCSFAALQRRRRGFSSSGRD